MNNMTEGRPLPLILKFALPLLGGNLFQQLYNIIDAAIVGRALGAEALAGVGASSSVQFLTLGFCLGTACGFAIPIAQNFGSGDLRNMRRYIYHSLLLTLFFSLGIMAVCASLTSPILRLLSTPDNIFRDAHAYLLILFLGIPCILFYNMLSGILRAVGDSRTPFFLLVFSTILNIILDLFCILVLRWGVAGAAFATVVSEAVSAALCLRLILTRFRKLIPEASERTWSGSYAGKLLIMGIPMGLQYSITAIGSMVMQSANNGLGSTYVSGFTAAVKIKQFALSPFDALATASSTFASQNYGASRIDRIKKGALQSVLVSIAYGIFAGLLLILFGRTFSLLFVSGQNTAVLDASGLYLRCMGYFYWALGILNICRMCLQGLGYSGRAIFSGVLEMAARCIVSIGFVPLYHYTAICFADQTAWCCAAIYVTFMLITCIRKAEKILK